ncbi:MAG TPA: DinB family protein [Cytophagales bacterium]|nr:DinB family protein [Cytophagales bacterium]
MNLKNLFIAAIAIVTMSFISAGSLTRAERKYAIDLMQQTRQDLLKKISGLTEEQLNFKADTSSWSVAECVEHLAISESNLFGLTEMALKEPADPSKRSEVKMSDEAFVKLIADRSTKRKTNEALQPAGKFGSFEGVVQEFKSKRDNHIKYIQTTSDDLRNHYYDFPFGKADAYQTVLLIAAHTTRHTEQIEEIMKHPDFPKKGK